MADTEPICGRFRKDYTLCAAEQGNQDPQLAAESDLQVRHLPGNDRKLSRILALRSRFVASRNQLERWERQMKTRTLNRRGGRRTGARRRRVDAAAEGSPRKLVLSQTDHWVERSEVSASSRRRNKSYVGSHQEMRSCLDEENMGTRSKVF